MAWRVAHSLQTLQGELNDAYPDRTLPDWDIGDASHQASASDHNPNPQGVVCAIDIRDGGIDLREVANHLKVFNHKAVKFVIYSGEIWSKARNNEGWRNYFGSNPHNDHIHVSVGVGSEGYSTGPYDDTSTWGISSLDGGIENMILGLKHGDKNRRVKVLQHGLRRAGYAHLLGNTGKYKDGVDGHYWDKTEAAVLACRKEAGSDATDGKEVTVYVPNQIQAMIAKREAEKVLGK